MNHDTIVTLGELCFIAGIMFFAGMCIFLSRSFIIIALPLVVCGLVMILVGSHIDSDNIVEPKVLDSEVQVSGQEYKLLSVLRHEAWGLDLPTQKFFQKNFKKVLTIRFKCGTISTRLKEPSKQNHFQRLRRMLI